MYGISNVGNLSGILVDPLLEAVPGALAGGAVAAVLRMETAPTLKLTQPGVIVGTPAYMAPEQVLGGNVDFRTDLFAFGLLIYELISGVNPFAAKTVTGTFARIVEHEPPLLSSVRPQTVPALDGIVSTCLRKDPVERYDSTQDLVADFEELEMEAARLREADSDRLRSRPADADVSHPAWWRRIS